MVRLANAEAKLAVADRGARRHPPTSRRTPRGRLAPCTSSGSTSRGVNASPPASPSSTMRASSSTSPSRQDDASIRAAIAPYVEGDCLVAFDAPLVVNNPTGQRPSEAALNRDFAKFEAGAHPTNTGKPEFAGTPRAARLATALDLDIDPESTSRTARHRGVPASGDGRAVPARPNAEVQVEAGPQLRPAALGAAAADGPRRVAGAGDPAAAGHRSRRMDRAAPVRGDRRAQERAAPRRGSRRRGHLRLRRRCSRPAGPTT